MEIFFRLLGLSLLALFTPLFLEVLLKPTFLLGAGILLIATVLLRRDQSLYTHRPLWEFGWLFLAPVLLILLASLQQNALPNSSSSWHWQVILVYLVLIVQVLGGILLLNRHRQKMGMALILSFLALIWANSAASITLMSLTGHWVS